MYMYIICFVLHIFAKGCRLARPGQKLPAPIRSGTCWWRMIWSSRTKLRSVGISSSRTLMDDENQDVLEGAVGVMMKPRWEVTTRPFFYHTRSSVHNVYQVELQPNCGFRNWLKQTCAVHVKPLPRWATKARSFERAFRLSRESSAE